MLTVIEFAASRKVSERTIIRLIEGGRLAAENFGTARKANWRLHPDAQVQPPFLTLEVMVSKEVRPQRSRRRRLASAPASILPQA